MTEKEAIRNQIDALDQELLNLLNRHPRTKTGQRHLSGVVVEMEDAQAADDAISALDGSEFDGRNLRVNEAHSKPDRRY